MDDLEIILSEENLTGFGDKSFNKPVSDSFLIIRMIPKNMLE